jgi:type II secretory pathway component PulK
MASRFPLHTPHHRRASILIVVLWIMIGIACVALYYADDMNLEYRASDNYVQAAQARQTIDGMRRYLFDFFTNREDEDKGMMPEVETDYEAEGVEIGKGKAWLVGRTTTKDQQGKTLGFGLIDEASKININTATVAMLQKIPNMTDKMAARIIDWRDADDNVTGSGTGAETQTYQQTDFKYKCKNGDFETLEELRSLLAPDDDTSILYGEDSNLNGVLDENENDADVSWPTDNADGALKSGILEYLTVYSRESNKAPDGTTRLNITSTTLSQQIRQLLTDKISSSRAETIMSRIANTRNMRSLLQFYTASGMTAEEFAKVDQYLTTSDAIYVKGLINVNTASADVLACIPGLTDGAADTLVRTRDGLTYEKKKSIAWVSSVLSQTQATQAGPYLTAHSYVFTADIAAVGEHGRGFQRDSMVIDTTEGSPQVIFHRDRTRLGWPLGKDIREQLDTEAGDTDK